MCAPSIRTHPLGKRHFWEQHGTYLQLDFYSLFLCGVKMLCSLSISQTFSPVLKPAIQVCYDAKQKQYSAAIFLALPNKGREDNCTSDQC